MKFVIDIVFLISATMGFMEMISINEMIKLPKNSRSKFIENPTRKYEKPDGFLKTLKFVKKCI